MAVLVPSRRLFRWERSHSLSLTSEMEVTVPSDNHRSAHPMLKDLAFRSWRVAATVGPLVAIALTLAAGLKWR